MGEARTARQKDRFLTRDRSREARLAAYPVGDSVAVAYNPADPDEAVLEPGPSWAGYVSVVAPAALALFGLLNLIGAA